MKGELICGSPLAGGAARVGELFFVLFASFDSFADFGLDGGARTGILFARAGDDGVEIVMRRLRDREGGGGEGRHLSPLIIMEIMKLRLFI